MIGKLFMTTPLTPKSFATWIGVLTQRKKLKASFTEPLQLKRSGRVETTCSE